MQIDTSVDQDRLAIYEHARDVAVSAARRAAGIMNARVGRLTEDDVREKGAHDLVTALDEEVQALLIDHLSEAFPDHSFLAEEGDRASAAEEVAGFQWIIDPIDGTTNFS